MYLKKLYYYIILDYAIEYKIMMLFYKLHYLDIADNFLIS